MSSSPYALPYQRSLREAFAVQCRVIGAIILRELHTRYGRDNIGYLWLIAEPMMLASVIGGLHYASGHHTIGSDMKPLPFAVLGYSIFILFRGIVNRAEGSLETNSPLLYHRQVTVLDLNIARAILETGGVFMTFLVLFALMITTKLAHFPARPLYLMAAWVMMFWYSFGQALIISAVSYENRTFGRFVHPYSYFMVGLSGAFVPMGWLPHPYREWLGYLPITSIFEMARYGQFQSADLRYCYPFYLTASCIILLWIGLVCVSRVRDRIHLQ